MHPRSREIRLRNTAKRQGLELRKSRRRDVRAIGFGKLVLVDKWSPRVVGVVQGVGFALIDGPAERFAAWVSLDVIERWLTDCLGLARTP